MNTAYVPLKSRQQLNDLEDAEILTLLQSSDPDSPSDDDVTSPQGKQVSDDPSPSQDNASVWKAAANLVNFIEGVGFLTVRYALKEGGVAAIVAFILIPISVWYLGTILIDCLYDEDELGKKTCVRSGYRDLGEALLPKYGGSIVFGYIQLDLFLMSVSYLVLGGSVMHSAFPSLPLTEITWISIAGGLVLPTTFLKHLSQISWLSAISVLALIAVIVSVVWYGTEHTYEWDLSTILFWDTEGVMMSLTIILYSYGATLIIPSVEGSMADKTKFSRALTLAYLVSIFMKLFFAFFGFLSFGVNTNEIILNNLPPGPVHIAVSSFFALSCLISYALILYPLFESLYNYVIGRIQNDKIPSILTYAFVRVTVVLSTVLVAILVPNFLVIVSFLGSACTLLSYIFPFILHLKLKYKQLKIHQVCIGFVLAFLAVMTAVTGTALSVKTLIKVYKH